MTKFLFVGGEFSSGNRGVDAITLGTIHCLRQFFPEARFAIVGFTSPVSMVSQQKIHLDNDQIDVDEAKTSFRRGVQTALYTRLTRSLPQDVAVKYFTWADVIVDISAGDGFGDTYGLKVFLRHSLGKFIAMHLNKPLAVFPQTMGPFQTPVTRLLARYLLRRANLVCVREQISKKIVQEVVGSSKDVACLADMAFLMKEADIFTSPQLLAELPKTDKPIGINISGFLWHRGKIHCENDVVFDYQEMTVGLIQRLIQETTRPILLVPHVFSEDPGSGDLFACREVWEHFRDFGDRVFLLRQNYSAPEIKAIIAQCEFFVGARMHACIAALSTGTPVVPISYSHKFAGILQRFEIQEWLVVPEILSPKQAIELILSGYQHREEIKRQILGKLPLVKSEAMRAGQLLKDTIG